MIWNHITEYDCRIVSRNDIMVSYYRTIRRIILQDSILELYYGNILRDHIKELHHRIILRDYITELYYRIISRDYIIGLYSGIILQNRITES